MLGSVPGSGVTPKWILVADDDDTVRDLWSLTLTRAGYRVLTARNGRDALELMRAVIPHLVVLDLRMPEIDGPAFLTLLQASPVLQQIPVLIISGYLEDESPRASLGLNIVGRLPKPIRAADLLAVVQSALAAPARLP